MTTPACVVIGRRVLLQIVRDKRTFGLMLAVPFIITIIFASAVSGEIKDAQVVYVNEDNGIISAGFISYLNVDERVDLSKADSWDEAKEDVDQGNFKAAIRVPNNFTNTLSDNSSSTIITISIYVDGTDPKTRAAINAAIFEVFKNLQEFMGEALKLTTREEIANEGDEFTGYDIAIPGIIAFICNFLILLITTLTLTREKTYRTRTRLFTTPIRPADVVIGYSLALSVVSVIMALEVLFVGTMIFGATVKGDWLLLLLAIIIFAMIFVFLGVLMSTKAKNELQAVQMGPIIALPSMALSGFLTPIESLPSILQPLSQIVPLTYGIEIMKGIMLKNYGIFDLWFEFLVIIGFCLIFFILAIVSIKEEE